MTLPPLPPTPTANIVVEKVRNTLLQFDEGAITAPELAMHLCVWFGSAPTDELEAENTAMKAAFGEPTWIPEA